MKQGKIKKSTGMVEKPTFAGKVADVIIILLCALVAFCSIVPLWHVFMCSFSDGRELLAHKGLVVLPVGTFNWDGYKLIFQDASLLKGYANTLIYVVGATFFGMFINVTGGYALSQNIRFKPFFTLFVVFTTLFGGGLVPTYMVIKNLGWIGSRWSLLIPGCTNAISVVMMMNAFLMVPKETVEAARIDGAGHLDIMLKVMLPQAMNLGSVLILMSVVGQWNAWFNASIYLPNNRDAWPLQLWIKGIIANNVNFLQTSNPAYGRYLIQYSLIVIATLPIIVIFPFFQEKMEKAVIAGAVKG